MFLQDQVAIVTGGGQGIGAGISRTLAAYGARVMITDINLSDAEAVAASLRTGGHDAIAVRQDVSNARSMDSVLNDTLKAFGSVDILVNNAGVAAQIPFDQITEQQWDHVTGINQRGLFFCSQAAGKLFKQQRSGKIVNISSFSGKKAVAEYTIYNATKAAAIMITQTMALELGPYNVNVNAICPGIVRTPIWDTLEPELWDRNAANIPLQRGQTVEDIGEAVAFLASERAQNITGVVLGVTGGLAMF
ncbi:SDR family oxidoreductase [Ochrobactrum sp. Q0168]|uniref:SDR family NAD(P)-dependent oxidoreductase n=1 Tax=Ochrobactrum sp. Q0168 TaxID=2793241 RepID=UPI0018ECE4F3|nr:SDR family oxidoreductase [Ochrobactrum sp. Q0168]